MSDGSSIWGPKIALCGLGMALALGGCTRGAGNPRAAWQTGNLEPTAASIQVSIRLPARLQGQSLGSVFRTQYVGSDVQDVVVGLFDYSSAGHMAGAEYTGSSPTYSAISSNASWTGCTTTGDTDVTPYYLATMMGCSSPGLIDPSGHLGLSQSQYQQANRWLVARKDASITGWTYNAGASAYYSQSVTFGNLDPYDSYYLFAEAFLKTLTDTTQATASMTDPIHNDVAGVATESVPALTPGGTTASALALDLTFAEATVSTSVSVTEATPSATL